MKHPGSGETHDSARATDLLFAGGGAMGARMRAMDWSRTPLGPVETWPQSLRTTVRILLTSRYAMWMGWGPELTFFYNDAYAPTLGVKQEWALGASARTVWAEIWNDVGPRAEAVLDTGVATWDEDLRLFLERSGFPEETYHTFSYSPLPSDDGRVGGMLCVVTEDTDRMLSERRLALLRELAADLATTHAESEFCAAVAERIARRAEDLPFLLLYLFDADGERAQLACACGTEAGSAIAPAYVDVRAAGTVWPAARIRAGEPPFVVGDLAERFASVPSGPWDRAPRQAVVIPIAQQGSETPAGFMVAGINPYRPFDAPYAGFVELLAGQLAAGLANARAHAEERRRAQALAELDRAKTDFFSNVSHEFRTPLALMLGPLDELSARDDVSLPVRQTIQLIRRNGRRLLKLVNMLLDFSRIEAGRMQATFEATDLAAYTAELASVFRSAMERAGLRYAVETTATRPVCVDREMWEKVVLNLLSNALKFTPHGGVTVRLRDEGETVVLEVADTGVGMPADELPRVFDRFHRVRGASGRTHEGTGIGLALVAEIVKLHGGTVGVESAPGVGTTFRVRIPTGSAHLPPDRVVGPTPAGPNGDARALYLDEASRWMADEEAPAVAPPVHATDGPRILLVDDNRDMREYVGRLLSAHWEVEAVGDGEAAVAAVARRRPDLILTDVMMPRLDGFGLLQAVRRDERTRAIPVVLLSARAGEEARVEGLAAGADDYLVKPFSARELLAKVSAHLEMGRIRSEAAQREARLNAELSDALGELETLFEVAPVAIAVAHDAACDHITVNPAFATLLGIAPEENASLNAAVDPPFTLCSPAGVPIAAADLPMQRAARTALPVVGVRLRIVRKDGGEIPVYGSAVPLWAADGRVRGAVAVLMDMTQIEAAQAERDALLEIAERARDEAERASQAKDTFLAVLSHELRSPLNAMVGWVSILKAAGSADPKIARAVETLDRNIWVQAQIIDDLLDVSRIVSGKLVMEMRPVALAPLVAGCLDSLRPSADGKHVRLDLRLEGAGPIVVGDGARLQQVVANLVGNAIKFTGEGGRVEVTVRHDHDGARVIVQDDGQGIAPDLLPMVFEPFRQADGKASRRHGGLGLGLAIVKLMTERHGGTVTAESDGEARGATFTVTLPLAAPEVGATSPAALAPVASIRALDVLLVEDEPDTRAALTIVLEQSGARVRAVGTVREALAAHGERCPDVLVSDIGIPVEDGYVLIRAVRHREEAGGPRTLAIALTGFASRADYETALRAGFDEHIGKPVDPEALLERMRVLIAARDAATLPARRVGGPGRAR